MATIPVTPGKTLGIFVGGEGTGDTSNCSPGYEGGFNGGGNGASRKFCLNVTRGGSSYIEPGAANTKNRRGATAPGNGLFVVSWT